MSNKDLKDLQSFIRDSFSDTKYPGDENLVSGIFPPGMPDSQEMYEIYHGKAWSDLDDEFFFSRGGIQTSSINFLTEKAFLYYLPAFMMHIISPGRNDTTDDLLWSLFDVLNSDGNDCKLAILKEMNTTRLKCVAKFLEFISLHENEYDYEQVIDAMIVLEKYWSKFLDAQVNFI